jgi:hypothetical protein
LGYFGIDSSQPSPYPSFPLFYHNILEKKVKIFCKIDVSPELVKQFNKWEFIRMMEKDLRIKLNNFGEVLEFKNDINVDLD